MAELEAALVAAQLELVNPPKTSTAKVPTKSGGSYTYTYAPLPEILDAVRPVLQKHGLAISQDVVGQDGYVGVNTVLVHESGERLHAGPVMLPATEAQQAGAIVTYLRRYALCAILGIAADEDDDASKTSPVRRDEPQASAPAGDPTSPADVGEGVGATKPAASSSEVAAAPEPGESTAKTSPGSTIYPLDPAKCSHKFPSGRWLKWDEEDRCPRCGTPKISAVEGTTADLSA